MRLLHLDVYEAASCGGLLDGLSVDLLRGNEEDLNRQIHPICLLGPNGSGKSQFLQVVCEIFQAAWHTHSPREEREDANPRLFFQLFYKVIADGETTPTSVKLLRRHDTVPKGSVLMEVYDEQEYRSVSDVQSTKYGKYLPPVIVAYTSGDNETLSLPFFISRSEYADAVGRAALQSDKSLSKVPENRLQLIDYATHLEVLIANLMVGNHDLQSALMKHANLHDLSSWRCIIQLNHPSGPKAPSGKRKRRGIQLTSELEEYIDALKRCATCWDFQHRTETYTFDFFVDDAARSAFRHFWSRSADLFRSLHKLSMLNDLMIPKVSRTRIKREIDKRHFAARLPEPQDEHKVFRFEEVRFYKSDMQIETEPVDYVSLSDGEHQQMQVFGMFAMMNDPNTIFLLDEPESHFNPQWRSQFISRLIELPMVNLGNKEIILTSHAPFIASDLSRENIRIFSKTEDGVSIQMPDVETYGATYDRILNTCFGVVPPMSNIAQEEIGRLKREGTAAEIETAMGKIASSVDRALLADRLLELSKDSEE